MRYIVKGNKTIYCTDIKRGLDILLLEPNMTYELSPAEVQIVLNQIKEYGLGAKLEEIVEEAVVEKPVEKVKPSKGK
jgi:hypothetical protein